MKKYVNTILTRIMPLMLSLLFAFACGCSAQSENEAISNEHVGNYEYYISDADVFIQVPNLRQYGDYTCGTTCVQMIMNYLYPYDYDYNLKGYEEDLRTDEDDGTSADNIKSYFDDNEVEYEEKENMSTIDLVSALDDGKIVLMCIQAWSTADDGSYNVTDNTGDDYIVEGHWVICVGYMNTEDGVLFYFNDPACVGYCVMTDNDLEDRWIDMDAAGTIYHHYGIEIAGNGVYDDEGVYYLY